MPARRGECAEGLHDDRVRQWLDIQRLQPIPLQRRKCCPEPRTQSHKGPLYGRNYMLRFESPLRMAKTFSWAARNKHDAERKKEIRQWSGPWNQILAREIDSPAETNSGRTHPPLSGCIQPPHQALPH